MSPGLAARSGAAIASRERDTRAELALMASVRGGETVDAAATGAAGEPPECRGRATPAGETTAPAVPLG